ncbi:MAG: CusA/CzcA family heavy metal efflux RND transporter [Candidatus Obscuribacterales bacterium]|nr:CusA/CzcA family heavy metal efflux RND transporter [Candidatus Obscuribacterales bacterium]
MLTKFLNDAIALFYRKRWLSILTMLLIFAGGVWAHYNISTEAYPEFTPPTVRVITLAPGKGAEEVERLITIPLEKELNAIPKEVTLRSISILGLSVISITFQDDSQQLQNRQQVLERISQADIPDDAHPGLDPDSGGTGEIYRYTLESKYYSPMSLKAIEDWQLERAFKQIPGVIDVVSFGGPTKNFQVQIDAKKLVSYGIPMTQVFQAIQNSNATTGGNYIENNGRAYVVRGLGLLSNIEDIERVVVSSTQDGVPVRIKDIAKVDVGPGVRLGQFGKNANDDAVMGIVLMRRGENASRVVERLYAKLPEIRASLPDGVHLVKLYDRQELVDHTLDTVYHNVFEGIGLVVAVLIVFLFDLSSGLIASIAIPLSLCLALLLLYSSQISANLLSLGAIDFGIIVDGAVVMVENAFARLSALPDDATAEERKELVLACAQQVGSPILFSITIIMVAFLPIFTFEGVAGKLFRPLVFTMNFNLVGAMVSALFIIPALISIFMARKKLVHRESPVIRIAHFIYEPLLKWSINNTWIVMAIAGGCLGLTVFLASHLGSEFLPALDEGNIWLRCTVLPTSVSLEESVKTAKKLRAILSKFPEIKNITSQTGCPDDGTDPNLFSNIETFLDLKPASEWRPEFHGNKRELTMALEKACSVIPNTLLCFSQYIQDNVDEAVAGAKGTLAIKIYGPDITVLQKLGDQIADICSTVPGMVDVANNQQLGQPQYRVAIDRDEASRYGVNVSDIQSLVETAVGGKVATRLIDGEKRFPVLVRFSKEYRDTERALDNILIDPPGPISSVPLSEMASIKYGYGAAFITREVNSRVMYVRINLRGRDLGSAVIEAQQKIKDQVKLPEGYRLTWAGQYQFQQEANARLMTIVPVTLLLIYLILLGAFGSHKSAFLIMCSVPLAGLGSVSALLITGTYFSISAAVGFIALSGVAVQNGVILVSYINQLRKNADITVAEAAYRGALDRMRPVLMTASVAMLGLLPAATSNGIGAQSQRPFAIVIIGGLLSATVLTLVVLPAMYTMIFGNSKKDQDMTKPAAPAMTHLIPILALALCGMTLTGCSQPAAKKIEITNNKLSSTGESIPVNVPNSDQSTGDDKGPLRVQIDDAQKNNIKLETVPVKQGFIYKTVDSPGRVGPNAETSRLVSTPSAGRAITVNVRLGENVKEGQEMATIKSDPIGQLQSDLLQNTLQSMADIKQQEVQLKLSRITFERETKLFGEQVSAKADLQTAENQLEKDEANLVSLKAKMDATIRVAQERLNLLGAPPDSAQQVIKQKKINPYVIIRAPQSGLVIERTINPGEMNDGTKQLFTISDLSNVWLFGDIFEKDIDAVKKGQEASVSIDSLPNDKFPAKIIWVGDAISPTTRSLPIRANVNNSNGLLKPGMFARMKVSVGTVPTLLVPKMAVIQKGDKELVFLDEGNDRYLQREVVSGADDGNNVEIVKGLKLGDKVVARGGIEILGTAMKTSEGKGE